MTADDAAGLASRLGFLCSAPPERLIGGNLNDVWRVRSGERSAVLKHAPPYVATSPDLPLDPSRNRHERRALERAATLLGPDRVPHVLAYDDAHHVLLLEDLGPGTPFTADPEQLAELGREIGTLHRASWGDRSADLANPDVQATRHALQYSQVPTWLAELGVDPARGRPVVSLGERLRDRPGRCFVMGDLWPAAVHVRSDGSWALIDWELAHHGLPLQDVAHLRAHLHLLDAPPGAVEAFLDGYRATGPEWNDEQHRLGELHEAAELLARTVGAFPLFDVTDPRREHAIGRALSLL